MFVNSAFKLDIIWASRDNMIIAGLMYGTMQAAQETAEKAGFPIHWIDTDAGRHGIAAPAWMPVETVEQSPPLSKPEEPRLGSGEGRSEPKWAEPYQHCRTKDEAQVLADDSKQPVYWGATAGAPACFGLVYPGDGALRAK